MTDTRLETLKAMNPAILLDVVRRDRNSPQFEIQSWDVTPLSHEKVVETTGGLYCFRGEGREGREVKPWSVVLKMVNRPEDGCADPQDLCYWKRELLAYQSGVLAGLPSGVRAPRCYGVSEYQQDAWIWMEHIQETAGQLWTIADYQRAARHLGQFAGAYLTGSPLPDQPWLCRSLFRSILDDDGWWAKYINPERADNAWQRSTVQALFPESRRARVLRIWAEKWRFIAANDRLPQVFCHNDAHRSNLMLLPADDMRQDLVAIDWAFCGPGGVGNDLGELVGTTLSYFAVAPEDAQALEAAVLEGYLAGLRDAGWSGDERLVRLGYTISIALWWGATLPHAASQLEESRINVEAKYGRPVHAVLSGWVTLAEMALNRADEARFWVERMI